MVVALCFIASAFLSTFVSAIPYAATAPALVVVGMMMVSSFREIKWDDFAEAVPAFFAGLFMALCYSISYGIAFGFIFYCVVKCCTKRPRTSTPSSGSPPFSSFSTLSCWPCCKPAENREGAWSCKAAPGALLVFLARGLALKFRWRRSARLGRPIFPGKAAAKRQLSK